MPETGRFGLPKNRPGVGVGADGEIATGHHRRLDSGRVHDAAINAEHCDDLVNRQAHFGVQMPSAAQDIRAGVDRGGNSRGARQ